MLKKHVNQQVIDFYNYKINKIDVSEMDVTKKHKLWHFEDWKPSTDPESQIPLTKIHNALIVSCYAWNN